MAAVQPNVPINTSSNSTVLVEAPTGQYAFIAVLGYDVIAAGPTNVSLQDSQGNVYAGPSNITPAGNGLVKQASSGNYCFVLPKGAALLLVQDSSVQLGGSLQFTIKMR